MATELEKKFRFESAHRLGKGYEGKCNNIHGHSWNGKIVVKCESLNKYDMGVDYADLKKVLKPLIDDLDHSLILDRDDRIAKELKGETDLFLVDGNPTSEIIAEHIYDYVWTAINFRKLPCKLLAVEIEETCTTKCIYRGE